MLTVPSTHTFIEPVVCTVDRCTRRLWLDADTPVRLSGTIAGGQTSNFDNHGSCQQVSEAHAIVPQSEQCIDDKEKMKNVPPDRP